MFFIQEYNEFIIPTVVLLPFTFLSYVTLIVETATMVITISKRIAATNTVWSNKEEASAEALTQFTIRLSEIGCIAAATNLYINT